MSAVIPSSAYIGIPLSSLDYGTATTDIFGVLLLFGFCIFSMWFLMEW